MTVNKLFRVIVRQRVRWFTGGDTKLPDNQYSTETEGYSIERDVTAYVESYHISASREALVSDCSIDFINPEGILTPTNSLSPFNRTPTEATDLPQNMYTPLLIEGNEIQIYRVKNRADLDEPELWDSRFRGVIKSIKFGTAQGQDSLSITAGDILTLATKRSYTGSFSPYMRSSNFLPTNTWYNATRACEAIEAFRAYQNIFCDVVGKQSINYTKIDQGAGLIPVELLQRMVYWDRDDAYYTNNIGICNDYYHNTSRDEPTEKYLQNNNIVPLTSNNPDYYSSIFFRNSDAWQLVSPSSIAKVSPSVDFFEDANGPLRLSGTIRYDMGIVPSVPPSILQVPAIIKSGGSIKVVIRKLKVSLTKETKSVAIVLGDILTTTGFVSSIDHPDEHTALFTEPTIFKTSTIANLLNTNLATDASYPAWTRLAINLPPIGNIFINDTDSNETLLRVEITVSGNVIFDLPRWEFTAVDVSSTGLAVIKDSNIFAYGKLERWRSEDGIIYVDPHAEHLMLSQKNIRVVARYYTNPYGAGSLRGYTPAALNLRSVAPDAMYERELIPGSDFDVLQEKGAIQLSSGIEGVEIWAAHTYYDIQSSTHQEAATVIKHLLTHGAGIPAARLLFEPTGIKLSKVVLDPTTTTSIVKAITDIRQFLPGNYHIYADGDGYVHGEFIQQNGSPRIYNPIYQTPVPPSSSSTLIAGDEYWYGVTAVLTDGKETLLSNILSTVPYNDYYDSKHKSLVDGRSSPAIKIKSVPNMAAIVIRRARAYKSAESIELGSGLPVPKYKWDFIENVITPATPALPYTVKSRGYLNGTLMTNDNRILFSAPPSYNLVDKTLLLNPDIDGGLGDK